MANQIVEQMRKAAQNNERRIQEIENAANKLREAGFDDPELRRRIQRVKAQNSVMKDLRL